MHANSMQAETSPKFCDNAVTMAHGAIEHSDNRKHALVNVCLRISAWKLTHCVLPKWPNTGIVCGQLISVRSDCGGKHKKHLGHH